MPNPSRSLASQLSWQQVLPDLVDDDSAPMALPRKVRCTLCRADELSFYSDHQLGGEWCTCEGCRFNGDLIELHAAANDSDITTTCRRLEALGLFAEPLADDQISAYLEDHVRYRGRLTQFWDEARTALRQPSPQVYALMQAFSLDRAFNSPRWQNTLGQCLGMASRQQIEELFAPGSYSRQERTNRDGRITIRRGGGPGKRRLFQGDGWTDSLVIPFFDVPRRPCGFLFLACNSDSQSREVSWKYKRANYGGSNRPVREAGVALSSMLDNLHTPFAHKVFVVDDYAVALILHARWLLEHDRQLPIVLAHYSPSVQTLHLPHQLQNRRVIMWGRDAGIFPVAKAHGAAVSELRISTTEIKDKLSHHDSCKWLQLMESKARTWDTVLRRDLLRHSPQGCASVLQTVNFTAPELRAFTECCSSQLQEKLAAADPSRINKNRIQIGGTTIIETPDGWQVERTGERISNYAIRVEELFTTKTNGNFYRGTASAGEKRHQFTVPVTDVDKRGLLPCIRDFLLEQQEGLLTFNSRWAKKSALIAFGFHEPRLIRNADRIGWDNERSCFLFPNFAINRGGECLTDLTPVVIDDQTPGRELEPPSTFPYLPRSPTLSTKSPESGVVWATIAAVLHNILSPALFRRPHGVVLDGEPAQSVGSVTARALGCVETTIRRQRHVSLLEQIYRVCHRHDWPVILRFPEGARIHIASSWLDHPAVHNAILSVDRLAGLGIAAHPEFLRIHSPVPLRPLGDAQRVISAIVPAYLLDLCKRKLSIDRRADHPIYDLLADLADWFGRMSGDPKAVSHARRFLYVDSLNPWANLLEVILHLHEEGLLAIQWDHRHRNRPVLGYHEATETRRAAVWIPVLQINDLLTSRHAPALDLPNLEACLRQEGVWLGIELYQGYEVWMLDRDWFDEEVKKRRRRERQANIGLDDLSATQAGETFQGPLPLAEEVDADLAETAPVS